VFPHENSGVEIVGDVSAQIRELSEGSSEEGGVPRCREEDGASGGGKEGREKSPGFTC
jgi:hypothetical protein